MADSTEETTPVPEDFTDPSPNPASDSDLAILCDALQEHGIQRLVIRYSGSGDEGAIEEIHHDPEEVHLPLWLEKSLQDTSENYCPDGYENNEGGYGTLTVYPFQGLAELEHADRFEDSEDMDASSTTLPEELRQRLVQLGVDRITTRFDGYGDSGQLDDFALAPEDIILDEKLATELDDFLLEQLPPGWEINEGSSGEFTVEVPEGTINVDANWRVEKSESTVTRWRWRQ